MDDGTILFTIFLIVFGSCGLQSQSAHRVLLQAQLDSIVAPYEQSTGTEFGPGMEFNFENNYAGTMNSAGEVYTARGSKVRYESGDTVLLTSIGVMGRKHINLFFEDQNKEAFLRKNEISERMTLVDSAAFVAEYDLVSVINPREFGPLWYKLHCSEYDDYSDSDKTEKFYINTEKETTLHINVERLDQVINLELNISNSHGKSIMGMGCAEDSAAYLEFKFLDGSVLKKFNTDTDYCPMIKIDISDHLDEFRKGVEAITLSYSKKTKTLIISEEISKFIIDIKLDCITN